MEDDTVEHGAGVLVGLVGGGQRLQPGVQVVPVLPVQARRTRVRLLMVLANGTGKQKAALIVLRLQGDV